MDVQMRSAILASVVAVGAALAAAAVPARPEEPARVVAEIVPSTRRVVALKAPGASIDLRVRHTFAGEAHVTTLIALTDHAGRSVQVPVVSPTLAIASGEQATLALTLPSDLRNGTYVYRVTVTARAGRQEARDAIQVRFTVVAGSAILADDAEERALGSGH